jgi:hypothetical protein
MLASHLLPVPDLTVRFANYAEHAYFFIAYHRTNLFVDSICFLKYSASNLGVDDDCSEIFHGNC